MKKTKLLLILLLPFIFPACSNCNKCCDPSPPNAGALFLSIKQNDKPYPDSLISGITMYYYYNGKKITNPVDDPNRTSDVIYGDTTLLYRVYDRDSGALIPGELSSVYALDAISYSQVNDFYLRFPDGRIDSLHIQIKEIDGKEVDNIKYGCTRQITSITLNGKELTDTPNLYNGYVIDNAIYLIEK